MKALVYKNKWDTKIENKNELKIEDEDEVIIDIKYCGICGTDLGIVSGDYPVALPGTTLGHEATGIVSAIGSKVKNVGVGNRVVINPTPYCGQCRFCKSLRINHCENKLGTEGGVSYDGAFAEKFKTSSKYVHKLSDQTSLTEATLTEPLSCVLSGVKKIESIVMTRNINTVVFGAGPMGILYTWSLVLRGFSPIIIEISKERSCFVKDKLPKNVPIFNSLEDALQEICQSGNQPLDLVVDTTPSVFDVVYPYLSKEAVYLTIGLKKKYISVDSMEITNNSLSIIGSIDSLYGSFEEALDIIEKKLIPVETFVSHTFFLEEYKHAFNMLGCNIPSQKSSPTCNECGKILLKIQ
ncbi:zinc-dependent alcohol dehydrogenase [Enterococcus faecalis]|uniref:zinc-dependent alcohol dehydrogenase n=1 Tax=Enterococcus faecalis TaxID=1351 RepID=UPI00242BAD64|nr:alcohol dehydrogenase catalytic domain-containing protein [Enterococcus faecalis]